MQMATVYIQMPQYPASRPEAALCVEDLVVASLPEGEVVCPRAVDGVIGYDIVVRSSGGIGALIQANPVKGSVNDQVVREKRVLHSLGHDSATVSLADINPGVDDG